MPKLEKINQERCSLTATNFKQEILDHYLDSDLLITLDRNPTTKWTSGNSLLYTGLFYSICSILGVFDTEDKKRFKDAVHSCEVKPGLYNRNPRRLDFESHDDYTGIAAGSYFCELPFASDIFSYGKGNDWHFNNVIPQQRLISSRHDRFLGLVCFYEMAAKREPSFCQRLSFNSGVRGSIDLNAPGQKILTWLWIQVAKLQSVCSNVCDLFEKHIRDRFGNSAGLFRAAIGPDHPFAFIEGV